MERKTGKSIVFYINLNWVFISGLQQEVNKINLW